MSRLFALAGMTALVVSLAYVATDSVETAIADRAVELETTRCGDASKTNGTGIIVGDGRVLTTAHTVYRAGSLVIEMANGSRHEGDIVVLDTAADLAIVSIAAITSPDVEVGDVERGDRVLVARGPSGTVATRVVRPVEVRIEEVGGQTRVPRLGYELGTRVALGDSGSGVYNDDGGLVGVVYGRNHAGAQRSFATGQADLERVLRAEPEGVYVCDPAEHHVVLR